MIDGKGQSGPCWGVEGRRVVLPRARCLLRGWACGWCFEDWREVIGVKSKEVKQGGE